MKAGLEDLSARARRGEVGEAELRQLELGLAHSLEARLVHRAGCEFDREDSVLPGDDELAERVTRRLLAGRPALVARRPRRFIAAAAVLLAAAAASAGPLIASRIWIPSGPGRAPALQGSAPQAVGSKPGRGMRERPLRAARQPPTRPEAESAPDPRVAVSSIPEEGVRSEAPSSRPGASAVSGSRGPNRAAELFAEAARARREGRTAEALGLYDALQSRHPSSAEAKAADITLGTLRLGAAPAEALRHFRRYLARGGALAPEALWGEARALSALGRTEEARVSYRTLLERFPNSAYANAARARLRGEQ